ncbi:helix-turn-helix transcriptional regulator [Mesorhizobium sp. M0496]|uniref:helix-turn-helix domain-containing protein n=1 Tax=unclassified Mesorhizobium TaxID=325217 RepID=UPI0033381000
MPESALGIWLKGLRGDLSLRELAQRSEVDHAYIYRLETGAKEAPSDEVVNKLLGGLAPSEREVKILRFLSSHPNVDPDLAEFARADDRVSFEEFHMLTTVVNRGARPDYATSLARIRRFMSEDEDG